MKEELSVQDITTISKTFFESGMFSDIKSASQAMVKIMAGAEVGLPAFQAMTGIHIIAGKPVIGAGLIASRVKGSGKYDYRILENTEKVCTIEFHQGKEKIGVSTFTIDDAKKAGTKNLDKFPKNMLFARAISNGVKWFCPDVFNGPVYTPEEFDSITEDAPAEVVQEPEPAKLEKQGAKQWLQPNTEQWTKAIDYLNSGGGNIDAIEKKYRLTAVNREMLLSEALTITE